MAFEKCHPDVTLDFRSLRNRKQEDIEMFKLHCAIGALLLSASLPGAVIPGLFNTGVDNAGNQVANADGIQELHWLQNGNAAFTFNINRSFGPGVYIDEDNNTAPASTASRWISINGTGGPGGPYTVPFTLSFSLAGFDPNTASISGRWATDNCGTASLNGGAAFSVIGAAGCESSTHFRQWTPFSIASGFNGGTNTLAFNLQNVSSVGAIRIEFTGSDATSTAPEPGTYGLMGAALVVIGWTRRRR